MLTPQALERASQAFRRGYRDGSDNQPRATALGASPFAAFDYNEGYEAGQNDAEPRKGPQILTDILNGKL